MQVSETQQEAAATMGCRECRRRIGREEGYAVYATKRHLSCQEFTDGEVFAALSEHTFLERVAVMFPCCVWQFCKRSLAWMYLFPR